MEHKEDPTKEMLRELGFQVSSVPAELLKGFNLCVPALGWMPIPRYSLLKDILKHMEAEDFEPASVSKFISSFIDRRPIVDSRICLIKKKDGTWGHLVATQYGTAVGSERSLAAIMSGDGFGPNCHFAVVPKGAR